MSVEVEDNVDHGGKRRRKDGMFKKRTEYFSFALRLKQEILSIKT